jgi:hypothetical protein
MANDISQLLNNPDALGLERQRQMAQMLLKQGMQTPQGQMIGDRYVPANPMQFVGNLFNTYAGQKSLESVDQQELALAKALREQDMSDLQKGIALYQGTPQQTQELAGPYGQGIGANGANVPMPTAVIPGQEPNRQAAMATLLGSTGPKSSAIGAKLYEQMFAAPEWKPETRYENGLEVKGWVNVKAPNPSSTFVMSSKRPDLEYAKAIDEGYISPQNLGYGVTPSIQPGQTPLSVRNNNPGNMVGADGKFLNFQTPEAGDAALLNDITLKVNGQSPAYKARFGNAPVTPLTLAETWSPASAKGNSPESTANYSKFIADNLGISINQPIPNTPQAINAVKSAITKFEAGAYNSSQTKPSTQNKQDPFAPLPPPEYVKSPKKQREWYEKQNEPLTGTPADKVTGAINYQNALDNYKNILKTYSPADMTNPDKRVALQEAYNTVVLTGKDAHSLGVLNGGDERILTGLAPNLNNPSSLLISTKAVTQAADGQKQFASNVITNQYKVHQKPVPENLRPYVITPETKDVLQNSKNAPLEFKSESDAAKAGIKKGTRIVINGVSGTWE